MRGSTDLLGWITEDRDLTALLANVFEFDVRRKGGNGSPRLSSSLPLEGIAGDFTGGMFYLCGKAGNPRPVLYANSEGDAGVIAAGLVEALTLVINFPRWRDCLTYSSDGDLDTMITATEFLCKDMLADRPEIGNEQSWAAETLGLPLDPPSALATRLHTAVRNTGTDLAFIDETGEYGGLFGPFSPSRNQLWQ